MDDLYQPEREAMVTGQIARRGLRDPRLLDALRRVPRHLFVPPELRARAYADGPLPIGSGQTISQPYIVALMTSLLALRGGENVLEIGTGSGYQAAVLAELVSSAEKTGSVHTIERVSPLAEQAGAALRLLGYANIFIHTGDGSLGWPENAPYNGILVTAAAPSPPQPLIEQLAEGGRLVIPVGGRQGQDLQLWTKENGKMIFESLIPVAFVPLRGSLGWTDEW